MSSCACSWWTRSSRQESNLKWRCLLATLRLAVPASWTIIMAKDRCRESGVWQIASVRRSCTGLVRLEPYQASTMKRMFATDVPPSATTHAVRRSPPWAAAMMSPESSRRVEGRIDCTCYENREGRPRHHVPPTSERADLSCPLDFSGAGGENRTLTGARPTGF